MNWFNHRDFYQKPLIQIGANDRNTLLESGFSEELTHWLIAMVGEEKHDSGRYLWKVTIYPVNSDGTFNWQKPFHTSPLFDCFDNAMEATTNFVQSGKDDHLSTVSLQEKIG